MFQGFQGMCSKCGCFLSFQSGNWAFTLAAEHGCVEMLDMLMNQYNMATMKPNEVRVSLSFRSVCVLQSVAVYAHSCLSAHLCVRPA